MPAWDNGKTDVASFAAISRQDNDGAIELSDTHDPCHLEDDVNHTKFEDFTVLRIIGLFDASALNGTCARIQNFVKEKGRYNLSLLDGKGATLKLVQPSNLEKLTVKEEVEELLKELRLNEVEVEVATQAILRLRGLPIDAGVLKETKIGKIMNDLTKAGSRLASNDVFANLGRSLVKRWREQFRGEKHEELAKNAETDTGRKASLSSSALASGAGGHHALPGTVRGRAVASRQLQPELVAMQSREDCPGDSFMTVDLRRCLARIWNNGSGGQCSHLKPAGKDLCGSHQSLLSSTGKLPHGRVDGLIPDGKQIEYRSAQMQNSIGHLSMSSAEDRTQAAGLAERRAPGLSERLHRMRTEATSILPIPPIGSEREAQSLVTAMQNAPTDRIRLSMLVALDRTHISHLHTFVALDGLAILERWIRERPECRFACLTLLLQLPFDKATANTLFTQSLTDLLKKVLPAEVRSRANAVLDFLSDGPRSAAQVEAPKSAVKESSVAARRPEPSVKRQKIDQEPVARLETVAHAVSEVPRRNLKAAQPPLQLASMAPQSSTASAAPVLGNNEISWSSGGASSSSTSVGKVSLAVNEVPMPAELKGLDPRIQAVLSQKPALISLLKKHPAIFNNFNKDSIARLGSLLKRSKDSEEEVSLMASFVSDSEDKAWRTVTIFNLPQEAMVSDVQALFDEIGPVEVCMPTESRKKKHVGMAFVLLPNSATASRACSVVNGTNFRAASDPTAAITRICAMVPARVEEHAPVKMVSWKSTDELWEVQMYDKDLSVEEGCQRKAPTSLRLSPTAESRSVFQEAARRERESEFLDQARMVGD